MDKRGTSQHDAQPMHYSVEKREFTGEGSYRHGVTEGQGICDILLDMRFSRNLVQGDLVPGQKATGKEAGSISGFFILT